MVMHKASPAETRRAATISSGGYKYGTYGSFLGRQQVNPDIAADERNAGAQDQGVVHNEICRKQLSCPDSAPIKHQMALSADRITKEKVGYLNALKINQAFRPIKHDGQILIVLQADNGRSSKLTAPRLIACGR
jgi:hypothetical protein